MYIRKDLMKNIYRFFYLNIILLVFRTISLIFTKKKIIQVAIAEAKHSLMLLSMRKQYKKSKKINYKNLYYHRSPMPDKHFFDKYYKEALSNFKIRGIPQNIQSREINQLDYILNSKKNFNFKNKKILNFGAGHGGFSILTSFLGAYIVEIDFVDHGTRRLNHNIERFSDFSNTQDKFDLIYASHTLEHLTDILSVLKIFKKLSHDNTSYLFEVPNGKLDLKNDNVFHTYFFYKEFFEKIFFQNKKQNHHFFNIAYTQSDGYIAEKESTNLVIWTNHSLNTDF